MNGLLQKSPLARKEVSVTFVMKYTKSEYGMICSDVSLVASEQEEESMGCSLPVFSIDGAISSSGCN